ncbi:hypothetical protein HDU87_002214 [Geranomyces variabilis]|uniref:Uncharacterized protein n=1 Tax=Geranomyces variabilis TaxID=109894 RepID=A0AAD5TBF0_9FUNG|nr:hypothetical protein HDU87_002214 [Geranomyces variabilis]
MSADATYPTPGHANLSDFPTPLEAAHKGLNPDPVPLETGLSAMPELPEMTHHDAVVAAAEEKPLSFAEKAKAAATTSSSKPATKELKPSTSRESLKKSPSREALKKSTKSSSAAAAPDSVVVPRTVSPTNKKEKAKQAAAKAVNYADAAAENVKHSAHNAADAAKHTAHDLERELRAETDGRRGWPRSLAEAWDKYWLVGSLVVGSAAVVVGVSLVMRNSSNARNANWSAIFKK